MSIYFRINTQKVLESVLWILSQKGPATIGSITCCLYVADERHLNLYARPVTGLRYMKTNKGKVKAPDLSDILDRSPEDVQYHTEEDTLQALRAADKDQLSETDKEVLDLSTKSTVPTNWQSFGSIEEGAEIPIELMIGFNHFHRNEILQHLREIAPTLVL